jgi:hypothetical protein
LEKKRLSHLVPFESPVGRYELALHPARFREEPLRLLDRFAVCLALPLEVQNSLSNNDRNTV